MNPSNDIRICISPSQGKIIIEEQDGPVTTRKEVDQQSLISCFKNSLRTDDPGFSSGFLPLNCLSVWQGNEGKRFVLWHPKLYADMTLYDTPYPHFPIPPQRGLPSPMSPTGPSRTGWTAPWGSTAGRTSSGPGRMGKPSCAESPSISTNKSSG